MSYINTPAVDPERSYKIKEVAYFINVTQSHAYNLCHSGQIKAYSVAMDGQRGQFRVRGVDILEFMKVDKKDYVSTKKLENAYKEINKQLEDIKTIS
jgi:hypothetical protein